MNEIQLSTKRLTVRPIKSSDWEGLKTVWDDFNRSPYVYFDTYKDTKENAIKRRIARWAAATKAGIEHMFFAVCLNDSFIGFIAFNIGQNDAEYELSYGFMDAYQHHGYAFESVNAAIDHMRSIGAKRMTAGTALDNTPSVALLERLGFTITGTETRAFHKDENGLDITFTGGIFEKLI